MAIHWQHDAKTPDSAIGVITRATVVDAKLVVEGRLMIDTNEKAMSVYERMLEGTVREFSIGYAIVAEHRCTYGGKAVNYLDDVELLEVSVVTSGANRFTRLVEVKSTAPAHVRTNAEVGDALYTIDAEEIAELGEEEPAVSRRLAEMFARIGAPSRSEATAFAFRERVVWMLRAAC